MDRTAIGKAIRDDEKMQMHVIDLHACNEKNR